MPNSAQNNLYLLKELISCGRELYFWTFDAGFSLRYTNCPAEKYYPQIFNCEETILETLNQLAENNKPAVMMNKVGLFWIIDFERNSLGDLLFCHVIGPAYVDEISKPLIEAAIARMTLPSPEKQELRQYLLQFPVLSLTRFYDYGLMLHYCITEEKIYHSDFQFPKVDVGTSAQEQSAVTVDYKNSWEMEQKMLRLIEDGNLDYKKLTPRTVDIGHVGQIGNGDPMRHLKNLNIVFTSLCARSAIKGGLTPEITYTLSERYISAIEASTSMREIVDISMDMREDFVRRVHRSKLDSGASAQIQNCCNYIQVHLEEKINIPELAAQMGYSSSHLAKLFKKETGMTVKEYIASQKILQAQDALRLSDESVQDICFRLGFGSQSYFGEQFKKATGMTPLAYRKMQGIHKK